MRNCLLTSLPYLKDVGLCKSPIGHKSVTASLTLISNLVFKYYVSSIYCNREIFPPLRFLSLQQFELCIFAYTVLENQFAPPENLLLKI